MQVMCALPQPSLSSAQVLDGLRAAGVELVRGDLMQPDTLGPAVAGIDVVVSCVMVSVPGGRACVQTARAGLALLFGLPGDRGRLAVRQEPASLLAPAFVQPSEMLAWLVTCRYMQAPDNVMVEGQTNLLNAAKAAGVKKARHPLLRCMPPRPAPAPLLHCLPAALLACCPILSAWSP